MPAVGGGGTRKAAPMCSSREEKRSRLPISCGGDLGNFMHRQNCFIKKKKKKGRFN